jgi:UDPglucose--hexose-1-phosphate uridylyltransferase
MLKRVQEKLGDPDYNYIVNSSARHKSGELHLHWWLQIRPRLAGRA